MEDQRKYVYNPWVLRVLYGRLLFMEQLRALYEHLHPRDDDLTLAEKSQLLGEARAEWAVSQLVALQQTLCTELYPLDWADCHFEYALYRLAALFRPPSVLFHPHCADIGDLYASEARLSLAVPEQQYPLVFGAIMQYVARYYLQPPQHHLLALLQNVKYTMEAQCLQQEPDVVVHYDRALVLTMMARVLLDELYGECKRRQTALLYVEGDTRAQLVTVDTQLRLLDQLRQAAAQQHCDEFRGYAVQAHPQGVARGSEYNQHCNRQYALRANPLATTLMGEEWQLVALEQGEYRYLSLERHRHHYVQACRRFVFDCALRRMHGRDCVGAPQLATELTTTASSTTSMSYARDCNVCRYLRHDAQWHEFYHHCEQSHRVQLMLENEEAGEQRLHRFLLGVLLPPLGALNSWMYRTLHEIQTLFADHHLVIRYSEYCRVRQCTSECEKQQLQLYEMVDLVQLIAATQARMRQRQPDAEADAVLCGIRRQKLVPPNEAQCALATRIVLLEQLQRGMDEQRDTVEAYERSLCNSSLGVSVGSSEELHRNVRAVMVDIYMSFRAVLKEWLAQ